MNIDDCVRLAVAAVPADVRALFPSNPLLTLTSQLDLVVRPAPDLARARDDGGFCDGMSFLDDGVVLYRPTGNRRENFTLAHELGHWVVGRLDPVLDWLADNDVDGRMLETICDRFARELLLPAQIAAELVGRGPVRAHHIIDLFDTTQASHPVCMIAVAEHLRGMGAIALIDRVSGEVTDASVRPDPDRGWPAVIPWRGQRLPEGHHLLELPDAATRIERITWRGRWSEDDFYVDVLVTRRKIVCVFADTDLWTPGTGAPLIDRSFDTRLLLRGYCCGTDFQVRGYPCPTCQKPYCPSCGLCQCERATASDQSCTECFRLYRPALLEDGVCVDCR
ncbi:hypothetical protein [Microbacterium invictum]|uniref:IrrE N-terminal-like domain-containing protein n=1 Tax=Microbacterium invictum TaxID=515415 RepID=A0ABZ0VDU5_9MICO|nr:hypothetical protein [Microbacterium invictum]WQB70997.1 hypothetical protein T9R20_03270 [Microbacterium invictum]